ncbi:MAG TPA: DUF2461 domain-containing protein [Chitinophagales bacterium]|nr:DUF2461 domain-containing protein [Chitinophagales bacterium]
MSSTTLTPSVFDYLKLLKKNNNREWFTRHKQKYVEELNAMIQFADALLLEMKKHDNIENESGKKSLFRIYRDTRFSNDKTPYKTHWSGNLKRATKKLRGSYYFHIEPGNCFIGGGFWGPEPQDLKRIRREIEYDAGDLKKILNSKAFKNTFGTLKGDQVQTCPKGFDPNHPEIDLLRYKQFILVKKITDKQVLQPDFIREVNYAFKKMRPFLDYMSEVLTTDENGVSITN